MNHQAQQFVKFALEIGAIELLPEGRQLKSKRISPYFFNSGLFNTGPALERLAVAYAAAVVNQGEVPDVLFGPAYKGIPLAAATALMANRMGYRFGYAFNRKEAKGHGEGGLLVGHTVAGRTVAILDDVLTTGDTKGEAANFVRGEGGTPVKVVIAFDRQEKGVTTDLSAVQEFERAHGIPVSAAATLDDLVRVLEASRVPEHADILPKILAYREEYGA